MFWTIVALVLGVSVCVTMAQQGDERTVELTREMVDALLQVLSPPCRVEMEGALASQMEISDECKFEIQRTLASFQSGQSSAEAQEDFSSQSQENTIPAAVAQNSGSPIIAIVAFIVVAVAAVAACVIYVNSKKGDKPALKPKKLSKKKEEKLRQKGNL